MSTLKVTNIQSNGTGFNDVVNFQNASGVQNGTLCRAWVNFNGTGTVAIRASFNVSSITDNGTGNYTVNFTNALADANYSYCLSSRHQSGQFRGILVGSADTTPQTGSFRIEAWDVPPGTGGPVAGDVDYLNVDIFR